MLDTPVQLHRPVRAPDGEGGTVESLQSSPSTIWVDMELDAVTPVAIFRNDEDVQIGDLLVVPHG